MRSLVRVHFGQLHAASWTILFADLTIAAVEYPVELAGSMGVIRANPSGRVTGFEKEKLCRRSHCRLILRKPSSISVLCF